MANLNSWQKLTRLGISPFGTGVNGPATISADPNTRATASGSASATPLTIGTAILANNDVFVIHQTSGTGVYQWEVNQVASGGGTTSIVCKEPLHYTYGTSAQVVKFPMNSVLTVDSFTSSVWNSNQDPQTAGTIGGITVLCAKTFNLNGTITGTGSGYKGGRRENPTTYQGEGSAGLGTRSSAANSNGGGGISDGSPDPGAAGGGHATAGSNGAGSPTSYGGQASGSEDGTTLSFGGAGGGSILDVFGGNGGGILIIYANIVTVTGGAVFNGETPGASSYEGGAGGGAGGAILIACGSAILGSGLVTASSGAGGIATNNYGGAGSTGRIAIHHSGAITGTTSPTFTDITDGTLVESGGSFLFNLT